MARNPENPCAEAVVRPLGEGDVTAFLALRREALLDVPLAFKSAPEDDRFARAATVARQIADPRGAIFGAFDGGGAGARLVGVAGVYLDPHGKTAHKARVWGVYVTPERRRAGLARALLEACLTRARALGASTARLSVSSVATAARALYEGLGFATWGVEPDALRSGADAADEIHMALALDPGPADGRILAR